MSEGWTVAGEGEADTSGWTVAGKPEPIHERTLSERFGGNWLDQFARGPSAATFRLEGAATKGLGANAPRFSPLNVAGFEAPSLTDPSLDAAWKDLDRKAIPGTGGVMDPVAERARRAKLDVQAKADPFWANSGPGANEKMLLKGGATLLGSLIGGMSDPTSWFGGGGKSLAGQVITNAGANAGVDVLGQAADVKSKTQDKWEPVQTLMAAGTGGVLAGGQHLAAHAPGWVVDKVAAARMAKQEKADAEIAQAVAQPWTVESLWGALEKQEGAKGRMDVVSPKGAKGPGQLMPGTAQHVADLLGRPELAAAAMSDDATEIWGAIIGGLIALFIFALAVAGGSILGGFVLQQMWNWFLWPFTPIKLGLAEAVGLSTLLGVIRGYRYRKNEEGEAGKALGGAIIYLLLVLAVGYVTHLCLPVAP